MFYEEYVPNEVINAKDDYTEIIKELKTYLL